MICLLDTHIAIWALSNPSRLSAQVKQLLLNERNTIVCSVISTWEVAGKHAIHPDQMPFTGRQFAAYCRASGYETLPVLQRHVAELDSLPSPKQVGHSDPFDRMLICQAKAEGMLLLTHDARLAAYDEPCVLVV